MTKGWLNGLLRNEWDFYGRRYRVVAKGWFVFLLVMVSFLGTLFVLSIVSSQSVSELTPTDAAIAAGVSVIVVVTAMPWILRGDRAKWDWYSSSLNDNRLVRDDVLGLMRGILSDLGYRYQEEEGNEKGWRPLFHTFHLHEKDLRLEVRITKGKRGLYLTVSLGPETDVNRERLRELRRAISQRVAAKYARA